MQQQGRTPGAPLSSQLQLLLPFMPLLVPSLSLACPYTPSPAPCPAIQPGGWNSAPDSFLMTSVLSARICLRLMFGLCFVMSPKSSFSCHVVSLFARYTRSREERRAVPGAACVDGKCHWSSELLRAIPTGSQADTAPSAAEGSRPLPKQTSREMKRGLGQGTGLTG